MLPFFLFLVEKSNHKAKLANQIESQTGGSLHAFLRLPIEPASASYQTAECNTPGGQYYIYSLLFALAT